MAFVLIPAFAVPSLLLGLAGVLALCALLMMRGTMTIVVASLATVACGVTALAHQPPRSVSGEKILFYGDTTYHHISVSQLDAALSPIRQPDSNIFRSVAEPLSCRLRKAPSPGRGPVRYLSDQAGRASFARAVGQLVPDATIVSVEHPAVVEIAREYLLIENRRGPDGGRGRPGLPDATGRNHDLIVLDAFNSPACLFCLLTWFSRRSGDGSIPTVCSRRTSSGA